MSVTLCLGDDLKFELPMRAARTCGYVANMIDDVVAAGDTISIPVPGNVAEDGMRKLVAFLSQPELDQQDKAKQDAFFEPFRKSIKEMIDLLNASSHLDCKPLFNLVCATACATYLRGQTPKSCLALMGFSEEYMKAHPFTDEEKKKACATYTWLDEEFLDLP